MALRPLPQILLSIFALMAICAAMAWGMAYYNQESADLDGYSIERAMGKHMLDVYPGMKETQSTMLSSLKK
ncbi:hypothetical protein C4794_26900, partial [Salmonella enterica subsp. enterica serovar Anatum]